MSEITQLKTIHEVLEHIQQKHPGWIVGMFEDYSDDYRELHNNWVRLCDTFKASPQRIIIIRSFDLDDHYSYAELLTKTGFVIRTQYEFIPCSVCHKILPTREIYEKLKDAKKNVPDVWSETCSSC
jgi:hypothetical protein